MKKVLSVLMAGALTASMAVTAFAAANPAKSGVVYDKDGVANKDVYASTDSLARNYDDDIKIDGVVPNAELYIALGDSMGDFYAGEDLSSVKYYTATEVTPVTEPKTYKIAKVDADSATYFSKEDVATGDDVALAEFQKLKDISTLPVSVNLNSLTDKDLFKFDVDKDEGSKYVSKIEVVDDKKLGSLDRTAYLKIQLNDSQTTSDLKSTGTITFKAKKSSADAKVTNQYWDSDKTFDLDYTFWINNVKKKNDDSVETGDRVFFDPDDNEDNTLVWGDDRAALFFEGNDDAGKFYARLQTKSDSEIYSTYGDPVNADLWFYDFVGNPTVPATSRATLTLGIPWDEDDDYTPKPEDCFIYEKDADGNLIDVTSKFTYSEDNDGTTEIEGWTIKTRTLGTYIISDTELDLDVIDDVDEEEVEDDTDTTVDTGKEIPNTGSSDMVGVAVVAAVVSLAAAGAVAFKKASK